MGDCIYCNKPAGMFKDRHKECELSHTTGKDQIIELINKMWNTNDISNAKDLVYDICASNFLSDTRAKDIALEEWASLIDGVLSERLISKSDEEKLLNIANAFKFSKKELNKYNHLLYIKQSKMLEAIYSDRMPPVYVAQGDLPYIRPYRNETVLWVYRDVAYYGFKARATYQEQPETDSYPVGTREFHRSTSFSDTIEGNSDLKIRDEGLLVYTDMQIHFAGSMYRFMKKHKEVGIFMPYKDGIGLQSAVKGSIPDIFKTNHGWFDYNFFDNVLKIQSV